MVDILIIGSGGAGLTAALTAKVQGASVTVVSKNYPTNAQTSMAQGGINAALSNINQDSIDKHIADTIKSAQGLCDEVMVTKMCTEAPATIAWLDHIGVPFSRIERESDDDPTGTIAQRQMGGASAQRACYAQDYTGLKILHTLYDACLKEEIDFLPEHYLLNLIVTEATVQGAVFLNIQTGEVVAIETKSVIIATGGYSGLYHNYTTNTYGASGDGIAAVLRAGGSVSDMEFVQFHPTALKHSSILMSESARGLGGYLINSQGERFVDELQSRDHVSRAIFKEIAKGEEVFLDLTHIDEESLMQLLPQEIALCRHHEEIDPLKTPIPIKPVAHYTMGGIEVDHTLEVKAIKGCFAVGECSNAKVHGANRLGGNSLLEITAFGRRVAQNAYSYIRSVKTTPLETTQQQKDQAFIENLYTQKVAKNFYAQRERLGELFYTQVGIIRENSTLQDALTEVQQMQNALHLMGIEDKSHTDNHNLIEFLEFRNSLLLASKVILAAMTRDESRGAHYKVDFEHRDDQMFQHPIVFTLDDTPKEQR